jgi:Ca2+-binding EF-hand superfamily protein
MRKCLQEDESKRLSWQEVYEHPIFEGKFNAIAEKNKKLSEKAGYVINKLRLEIHSQNIDMEKLFNRLKYSKATSLRREEFFSLLKTLDSSIDDLESQYVFEKFDADGNGLIDLE